MKRTGMIRLIAIMLMFVLIFAVTSCAKDSENGGDKVKIKMYNQPQDDVAQGIKDVFEFEKQKLIEQFPDYEFEFTRFAPGQDYRQQYDKELIAGGGPTIWAGLPYVDIQSRIKDETIADITEYVENWDLKEQGLVVDTFDEALTDADGKWYAVPYAPYVSGLLYNRSAIEAAGGDPTASPATWEEFIEMCVDYTDLDAPRFGYTLLGSEWAAWPFTPWVWSAGGEMVRPNSDGTYSVAFNEEAGVDAAMLMHDLIHEHKCTQTNVLTSYDDMMLEMMSGRAAFGWGTPLNLNKDTLAKYDQEQDNYGFFPLPGKSENQMVTFAGGEVWTMNPKATKEQKDAGWEVIKFLSFDEEYLVEKWELENEKGVITANSPVRTDLIEKKYSMATSWPDHWADEYSSAMTMAKPEPFCADWNSLKNEIVPYLQKIFTTEEITREEAKMELDACAELIYEKYPESFKKAN